MGKVITLRTRAQQTPRWRGWRMRIYRDGAAFSELTRVTFAPDVPQAWHDLKNDSSVRTALLYRTGRKFATYDRDAAQ